MAGSEALMQRFPRVPVGCTTQTGKHCDNLCEPELDFRSPGTLFQKCKTPWFIPGGAWHATASELTAGLQLAPAGIIDFIYSCLCSPKEAPWRWTSVLLCFVSFHIFTGLGTSPPLQLHGRLPLILVVCPRDPGFQWMLNKHWKKNNWLLTCGCKIHHHALNTLCIPSLG